MHVQDQDTAAAAVAYLLVIFTALLLQPLEYFERVCVFFGAVIGADVVSWFGVGCGLSVYMYSKHMGELSILKSL